MPPAPRTPERWQLDAGETALATLRIPADAQRERRFEIACAMTVRVGADAGSAWHEMTVLANGAQQWKRRINSHGGGSDGLDYRFARSIPVGQALVLKVSVACRGAQRRSLVVEADEIVSPLSPAP